jgi:hypothetical protein
MKSHPSFFQVFFIISGNILNWNNIHHTCIKQRIHPSIRHSDKDKNTYQKSKISDMHSDFQTLIPLQQPRTKPLGDKCGLYGIRKGRECSNTFQKIVLGTFTICWAPSGQALFSWRISLFHSKCGCLWRIDSKRRVTAGSQLYLIWQELMWTFLGMSQRTATITMTA